MNFYERIIYDYTIIPFLKSNLDSKLNEELSYNYCRKCLTAIFR